MSNGTGVETTAQEPQINSLIRSAVDNRERAESIQHRLEAMLGRLRGDQPVPGANEVGAKVPHQQGTYHEVESTIGATSARLGDLQALVGELENYI